MKTCPHCAEQVQDEAKVCRFCGHKFGGPSWLIGGSGKPQGIGCGSGLAIFIVIALGYNAAFPSSSSSPNESSISTPAAKVFDPKPCEEAIQMGERAGMIKGRPAANRIDVEDRLWAEFPAASKKGLALAVRCAATGGAPGEADYAVVYGYRSGKRLAMATSVGVDLK